MSLWTAVAGAWGCQRGPAFQPSQVKIVGGTPVDTADPVARSTVALVIATEQGTALCTGSLIDSRHVVSAAHCLAGQPDALVLDFGLAVTQMPSAQVQPHSYAVHQNYGAAGEGTPPSDISLVTLSEDAPAGFTPVPMLAADDPLTAGETVTLAGFGQTSFDDQSAPHLLRKVDTRLVRASAKTQEIEVGNTPGRGACHGDSGGPAFVERDGQLYLVGVTSRDSYPDGRCLHNTIYTDVRYYRSWLADSASL